MKKIFLLLLTISSLLIAKEVLIEETSGWKLILEIDDFDDTKKKCHLFSRNFLKRDAAGLAIMYINHQNKNFILTSGSVGGRALTYRVDKNDVISINDLLVLISKETYNNLIQALKNGKEIKIKVTPINDYAPENTDIISLDSFERLYKLAETCNY